MRQHGEGVESGGAHAKREDGGGGEKVAKD
jgi:hypothetical protein